MVNILKIFLTLTLVIGTLILNLTVSGLAGFSLAALNPRDQMLLLVIFISWN